MSNIHKKQWFIGPTVHKSINLGGSLEWKFIWKNILESYNESSSVQFYWMLTCCLGKILLHQSIIFLELPHKLHIRFKNISESNLYFLTTIEHSITDSFDKLFKTFIYISFEAAKIVSKNSQQLTKKIEDFDTNTIDIFLTNIRKLFKQYFSQMYPLMSTELSQYESDAIKTKSIVLQNALKLEIEQLFCTIYKFLVGNETFDPSKLLPEHLVETWNHLGPIFWLWFHITAGKLKSNSVFDSSLKEFFNNIDIFISCGTCKEHFQIMRQSDDYQKMKENLSTDLFFIQVHQIVRKNHYRAHEGNEKFIDDRIFKNSNYIYSLREEYISW